MKTAARVLMIVVLALLCGGAVYAVPPAYSGPLGNPEEPALRPYKWLWRGVKALVYQPVVAIDEGNRKTPVLGTAEVVRGVRKGSVELGESVVRGVLFSIPPGRGDYRRLGPVNAWIDREPFASSMADLAACCYLFAFSTSNAAVKAALALFITEQVVEAHPLISADERARLDQKASEVRAARKLERQNAATAKDPVRKAQAAYLGDRMVVNEKPAFMGDISKTVR